MGIGRSGRPLRGDTAYTDPFPEHIEETRGLGGAVTAYVAVCQPLLLRRRGSGEPQGARHGKNTAGGPCLCLEDTPRAIDEGHTSSALLQRLLAAMQFSKPHTKARGGVCRKAALSNHAEGQLRCLPETAQLLHRENDAMRGASRSLLQVAMQSYYVVSSSQLFLVLYSKHISKTANTQQAKASHLLCHREESPLPCFSPPAPSSGTKSLPQCSLSPRGHRRAARLMAEEPEHEA
jgi:hypothetical protein